MNPKRIGFLVFPAMQALDLAGPMDAFAAAVIEDGDGGLTRCYEPVTIGLDAKVVAAESGLCIKPQFTLRSAPRLDTLVIPAVPACAIRRPARKSPLGPGAERASCAESPLSAPACMDLQQADCSTDAASRRTGDSPRISRSAFQH